MQARYVILRVLLEAGDDLVTISKVTNPEDNQSDLIMSMDRSKIGTVGKKAIGDFLRKLQVWDKDVWMGGRGGVVFFKVKNPEDNQSDLIMSMDPSKIGTVGKKAIGDFLRKLQV